MPRLLFTEWEKSGLEVRLCLAAYSDVATNTIGNPCTIGVHILAVFLKGHLEVAQYPVFFFQVDKPMLVDSSPS